MHPKHNLPCAALLCHSPIAGKPLGYLLGHTAPCACARVAHTETGPVHAQDGSGLASSSRPAAVLRSRSAAKASGGSSTSAAALRKHPTPPYGRLSAAAAASASAGQTPAAALAAAAAPLGVELPSALHHVAFSSGASVYTPSQLLEVGRPWAACSACRWCHCCDDAWCCQTH